MDFILYSTACGYDIMESTYHDYYNKLNKSGIHWYIKKVKVYYGIESVVFVTINSAEDFITLSEALDEELIIKRNQDDLGFYELEIYDDYRE